MFEGAHLSQMFGKILKCAPSMFRWGTIESNTKVFAKKNIITTFACLRSNVPPQKLCAPRHACRACKINGPGTRRAVTSGHGEDMNRRGRTEAIIHYF